MKKFIALLMAVFMVASLAISASATVTDARASQYGELVLPTIPNVDSDTYPFVYLLISETIDRYGDVVEYYFVVFEEDAKPVREDGSILIFANSKAFGLNYSELTWVAFDASSMNNRLVWSNEDAYDINGSLYMSGSDPIPIYCDGSSCSATDADSDGICDDCGMTLMLAAPQRYTHSVTFRYSDGTFVKSEFTSDTEFSPTGVLTSNAYRVDNGKVVEHIMYESFDGTSWDETRNNSVSSQTYTFEEGMTVYQSTFDWYDESGNRFFPVPLWEQVVKVTQGEMQGLTQEMGGTMKVLVPCGVGLMALLVVLSLFGKRSLISLR